MLHADREQFATILDTVDHAGRFLPHTAALYEVALERLVATPSPDLAGLVAKLGAIDPFNLDHFHETLADARRLSAESR